MNWYSGETMKRTKHYSVPCSNAQLIEKSTLRF